MWVSFNSTTLQANFTNIVAEELYDVYHDPGEDDNLITVLPNVGKQLYNYLIKQKWLNKYQNV